MYFLNELLHTLRVLKKHYLFTLLCASVLAVGVGIVLPLYVLVENLALKTPDFTEGDRFIAFRKDNANLSKYDAFHFDYFRENSSGFADLYAWSTANYTISDGEYAEAFKSAAVEPGLLLMPQVQAVRGRLFNDDDAVAEAGPVALISYDLWQSYYAAREDIIGHQSRINGETRTIVGVMPPGFRFPFAQDLWVPMQVSASPNAGEGLDDLMIVGKLKAGVRIGQASEQVGLLQDSLVAGWPDQYPDAVRSSVVPYIKILDNLGVSSLALIVVFGSLVLIVAFNIGNLFLARGEERLNELSVRSAVGASAGRLAVALLMESFVVCCLGLACGWVLAYFALQWIEAAYDAAGTINNTRYDQLFWWDMELNGELLVMSAVGALLVWLLSGGLPAWRLSRSNLSELLASGGKGTGEAGVTRSSKLLVNAQLILGCVLLTISATQVLTSFTAVATTTAGAETIFLGKVTLSGTRLTTHAEQQQYLDDLQQTLASRQEVQQVVLASAPRGGGGPRLAYTLEEQDLRSGNSYPSAFVLSVSSNYFDLFGYQLLEGRNFNAGDAAGAEPVVIIDQRFAQRHWPDVSALGRRLQINPRVDSNWYTVVGVSAQGVQEDELEVGRESRPIVYQPASQHLSDVMYAIAQVNSDQLAPLNLFREAANAVDRDIPISDPVTLDDQELVNSRSEQFNRSIYMSFIFIALYVTGIATYGLAARIAGRRRVETGIRMAVGASRSAAMRVFLQDGLKSVVTGLSVGIFGAILLGYLILQGVNVNGTFVVLVPAALIIGALLGLVVMLANYFSARQLVVMEPAEALRHE